MVIDNNRRDSKVLIALNDENPAFHNIYEFNLITNEMRMVFRNGRFPTTDMTIDNNGRIRLVMEEGENG